MATIFPKRLKYLRNQNNITLRALGKELGLDHSTLAKYESGEREPNIELIMKIAAYFNVSTSYLLGETDNPHPFLYDFLDKEPYKSAAEMAKQVPQDIIDAAKNIPPIDPELVKMIEQLPMEDIARVKGYMDNLIQQNDNKKAPR